MTYRYAWVGVLLLCACAHGGSGSVPSARCLNEPIDSVFLMGGPVYRECEVGPAARVRYQPTPPNPFETLSRPFPECLVTVLEFVVDTSGLPEILAARVVETNRPEYAQTVKASLARWRFWPALRQGQAVRQVVRWRSAIGLTVTVSTGTPRAPTVRPNCH
jgi:hypothetical protein